MNILTGKALSRRHVLKGLGATVALPFLDAMIPATVRGGSRGAQSPARRFLTYYTPNGKSMEYWNPEGDGPDFELTPIMQPLAAFKDQMIVLTGINASWTQVHAGASGSFLNGVSHGGRNEVEILADVSIDQILARHYGNETQLGSLELSMDAPALAGQCSSNLSCVYTHTLSWAGPNQPIPTEYNPRAVFERLFGDSGSTERAAREARLHQQRSIMDAVMGDMSSLERQLGASDKVKLDEYADVIRDVERRIGKAEEQIDLDLPVIVQPQGVPNDYEEHVDLIQDLKVLAFRTDLTRVISFMVGKEQSARTYPQTGVAEAHHPLSHHGNDPALVAKMAKINIYHAEKLAQFLTKLRAAEDQDGSILDNTIVVYGSGISNSSGHSGTNIPIMLLGGGAGRLQGNRHINYTDHPTQANMLVTLLDKFDVPMDHVGSSTGKLPIDRIDTLSGV